MTDETNKSELTELELARRIRNLESAIQPDRDLWKGIERQIMDVPQPVARERRDWMPYGVAASLLLATAALLLNLMPLPSAPTAGSRVVGFDQLQTGALGSEYLAVRSPMVERFDRVNSGLEEATRLDLMRNLDILKNARLELERELRLDPTNQRARQMLIRVHEQELALLRQDYLAPARSL